jgi:DNA-binding CsgD family transcriptional regulator
MTTTLASLMYAGKALTPREIEVLQGVADGETAAQTGRRVYLSEETVKTYRKRIVGKLEARNGPHAVAIGLRRGILS